MKLYGFPPSPNTWKVRAVAAHLGLPLELQFVDLTKGQQRTPDYLALNPTGRTPDRGGPTGTLGGPCASGSVVSELNGRESTTVQQIGSRCQRLELQTI